MYTYAGVREGINPKTKNAVQGNKTTVRLNDKKSQTQIAYTGMLPVSTDTKPIILVGEHSIPEIKNIVKRIEKDVKKL